MSIQDIKSAVARLSLQPLLDAVTDLDRATGDDVSVKVLLERLASAADGLRNGAHKVQDAVLSELEAETSLQTLFSIFQRDRDRLVERYHEAGAALRSAVRTSNLRSEFEQLLASIVRQCGDCISYQYPTAAALGISAQLLASDNVDDERDVTEKRDAAVARSLQERGHIQLLLDSFDHAPSKSAEKLLEELADVFIETSIRIGQLDGLLIVLLDTEPGETDIDAVAEKFCNAGGT